MEPNERPPQASYVPAEVVRIAPRPRSSRLRGVFLLLLLVVLGVSLLVNFVLLAGLTSDEVRVVEYKPEFSLLGLVMGEARSSRPAFDAQPLVELASPKAYYLCTWLVPLLSSGRSASSRSITSRN